MDKNFSLYLDLTRFLAAFLVVLSHYSAHGLFGPAVKAAGHNLGRESVMVFFILSGFVIAWTCAEQALTLRQYVVARSARIYSVALPVLLAAFGAALVAAQLPGITVDNAYQLHKLWLYIPLHALFMGDLWTLTETPPWLVPYWSLCYEVWYYVLFGILYFGRGPWRVLLAAAVLLVMGPKLWLLLPVWLAGVLLYKLRKPLPITTAQARAGWAVTLAALALYKIAGLDELLRTAGGTLWPFPGFALSSANRYLADYLVTLIMVPHFMFARQAQFGALQAFQGPIRALASYTFALYLVHGLVMGLWEQFVGVAPAGALPLLALSACIGLATYACGMFGEHQRAWLRRRFAAPRALAAQRLA